MQQLDFADLKKLGATLKRARFFITCKGKYIDRLDMNELFIRQNLLAERSRLPGADGGYRQISLLEYQPALMLPTPEVAYASLTGEL
jgi:predicted DNA-binding helix-hairpin-helix protein